MSKKNILRKDIDEIELNLRPITKEIEQILQKTSKIKAESNSLKSVFGSLGYSIKNILGDLGKSLASLIVGNKNQGFNFGAKFNSGFTEIMPKMLNNFLAGTRAKGGPVNSNKAYLVGEQGPELFIPNLSGQVIPNHDLHKQSVNIVMNISTPDSDSFRKSQNQILNQAINMIARAGKNL